MLEQIIFWCCFSGVALLIAPFLDRRSRWVRIFVIWFSFIVGLRYTYWRITSTLPAFEATPVCLLAYAMVGIEAVCLYASYRTWRNYVGTTDWTPRVDENLAWYSATAPPRIHVLIATYNEAWTVLERTLVGAKALEYPNYRIWILDDGGRDWLRQKAQEWGVEYVSRTNNANFKAGNINNALQVIRSQDQADFFALADADFVLRPAFLRRTLALMVDEKVGLVQTPQWFYNEDPFQKAFGGVRRWPDEQRMWLDFIEPALDAMNSATCCGTSCLVRATALRAIGDFPTESICEDTLCSLKMKQAGYFTRYLAERLSVGLSPESMGEFISQRARWLVGGYQNSRWGWNQRFASGTTGPGALDYWNFWIDNWRMPLYGAVTLGWTVASILFLTTGDIIFEAPFLEIWAYMLPVWIERFLTGWLTMGRRTHFIPDVVARALMLMWFRSALQYLVFGTVARFNVTRKAITTSSYTFNWLLLRWLLIPIGLLTVGSIYVLLDPASPRRVEGDWALSLALSGYFLCMWIGTAIACIERPQRRVDDRYEANERVRVRDLGEMRRWHCKNISVGGALLETDGVEPPTELELELDGVGTVRARLVRSVGSHAAAYAFASPERRSDLIRKIYCTDHYVPLPVAWSLTDAFAGFLKRLVPRRLGA